MNEVNCSESGAAKRSVFDRFVMRFTLTAMLFYRDFKPGQKYIFRDHVKRKKNPFAKDEKPLIVEIIATEDGWINYKHVDSTIWQDESMERSSFNFCYMRLDA